MGIRAPLLAGLGCTGLSALSLVTPSAPTTDAWAWIVWGREVVGLDLDTNVGFAPAWKPLPVLITAPLSIVGHDAPTLWILIARALGLLGLVIAFHLAYRLVAASRPAGAAWSWAGAAAGALAVAGVVLSKGWMRTFLHGFSEPAAMAFTFLAVERHLAGRRRQAFLLGALVSLARPEAFALLSVYGVLLLFAGRRSLGDWVLVAATLVLVPALWLVPDWVGAGDPFHSSEVASRLWAGEHHDIARTLTIAPAPLFVAAAAGTLFGLRRREWPIVAAGGLAFAWIAVLLVARLAGYPASPRFFAVPEALVCVAGAAGAMMVITAPRIPWLELGLAGAAGASLWLSLAPRVDVTEAVIRGSTARARAQSELATAIRHAGGEPLRRCGVPRLPFGTRWTRGVVAWSLDIHLRAVRGVPVFSGVSFVHRLTNGSGPANEPGPVRVSRERDPSVLFLPIGDTAVRWVGHPRVAVRRRARFRHWAVYVTGGPCV